MRRLALIVISLTLLALASASPALAWKPFTHNWTGFLARGDLINGNNVEIAGKSYPVRTAVADAVRDWEAFYNAGVVGPDGFPDLIMGQAVIHPKETGAWMKLVIDKGWEAYNGDPRYIDPNSPYSAQDQREQILAFAYGYATHAAGDMWAHTLMNDFAQGVFPGPTDILGGLAASPRDTNPLSIAMRHLFVEAYAGDATPGFDGNKNRGPAPGGDVSDDSTQAVPFDAPITFLYEVFVNPRNPVPVNERGPLLDFFIDLEADVQVEEAAFQADRSHRNCLRFIVGVRDPDCNTHVDMLTVDTVRGQRQFQITRTFCDGDRDGDGDHDAADGHSPGDSHICVDSPTDAIDDVKNGLVESYLEAWIDDLDNGLKRWGELGLGVTRAMFDPQTRRDFQNANCVGPESSQARADCEEAVGTVTVILDQVDPFINQHLLSMLGAPDALGAIRQAVQDALALLGQTLNVAFSPLGQVIADVKKFVTDKIKAGIAEATKINVDAAKDFLAHPSNWMDIQSIKLDLPLVGNVTASLYKATDHAKIDQILGLAPGHHNGSTFTPGQINSAVLEFQPAGASASGLSDSTEFDIEDVAPLWNTLVQSKLLFLDGKEMNNLLRDILVSENVIKSGVTLNTFADGGTTPDNIMVRALPNVPNTPNTWLRSIDSDHSWRHDGLPVFCDIQAPLSANCLPALAARVWRTEASIMRDRDHNGGYGNNPLWESCLLRPTFRVLYEDWENGPHAGTGVHEQTGPFDFPAHGDPPSADPNDPNAPESTLNLSGNKFVSGGTTYVGGSHSFTLTASEDVFLPAHVKLRYRSYKDGASPGAFQPIANGGTFSLSGSDGVYHVEFQAEDPCHTFDPVDGLNPEDVEKETFTLDTTPPTITIASPASGSVFDIPDTTTIQFSATDGPGSGVGSTSVTFDGASAANGQLLDMFFLEAGVHTIVVNAADNLGNAASLTRTFVLSPTIQGLRFAVNRAIGLGQVEPLLRSWLDTSLQSAQQAHNLGLHDAEKVNLRAFIDKLGSGVRAGRINAGFGGRAQRWTQYLILNHP
jgi:hypothetical protein